MKILYRRFVPDEKDSQELRLLRQMIYLIEQNRTYELMSDDEYRLELEKVDMRVKALEEKYGTDTD